MVKGGFFNWKNEGRNRPALLFVQEQKLSGGEGKTLIRKKGTLPLKDSIQNEEGDGYDERRWGGRIEKKQRRERLFS